MPLLCHLTLGYIGLNSSCCCCCPMVCSLNAIWSDPKSPYPNNRLYFQKGCSFGCNLRTCLAWNCCRSDCAGQVNRRLSSSFAAIAAFTVVGFHVCLFSIGFYLSESLTQPFSTNSKFPFWKNSPQQQFTSSPPSFLAWFQTVWVSFETHSWDWRWTFLIVRFRGIGWMCNLIVSWDRRAHRWRTAIYNKIDTLEMPAAQCTSTLPFFKPSWMKLYASSKCGVIL